MAGCTWCVKKQQISSALWR